jgi:hypothetical protein
MPLDLLLEVRRRDPRLHRDEVADALDALKPPNHALRVRLLTLPFHFTLLA